MANNVQYVTAGKPKITGAVFSAPAGSTLPLSTEAALADAFKALGYVSDAGVANNNSKTTSNVKAWGGDVVLVTEDEKTDTYKLTLIESTNPEVLKAVLGEANVSGSLEEGLRVTVNNADVPERAWVIDMVLRGPVAKRHVIPRGKISAIDEITYADNSVVGYGITITCLPDGAGNTHYEYLKSTSAGTVALDEYTATVAAGETVTLTATTSPAGGTVKWETSDSDFATVTGGVVTGVAAGEAVITARVVETGARASCTVTVTEE